MTPRTALLLAFTTLSGAGMIVAGAQAQQPGPPPAPAEKSAPAAPGAAPPPPPAAGPAARGPRFSAEDRAAFFEARIAAVKAGLRLTPEQDKMWPPVESAVRDMVKQGMEAREKRQAQGAPADPVERIARMGEMASQRGAAMTRVADAARPLYASLNVEQKRRLMVLVRPMRGHGMHAMMHRDGPGRHGMRGGPEGRHGDHHMGRHHERGMDRHGERDMDRRGGWRDGRGERGERGDRWAERDTRDFGRDGGGWRGDDDRRGMRGDFSRDDYYRR